MYTSRLLAAGLIAGLASVTNALEQRAVTSEPAPTTSVPSTTSTTLQTSITTPASSTSIGPTSGTAISTTTSTAPSVSPTMPGLAANCDGFYKVVSGDQCNTIAAKYGVSTAQFLSWNSEVNNECTNLWLGYYVCVHVAGATTTPAPAPTGPTPQMPGIIAGCKSFHLVQSGDSCWSIYTAAGISFDQFLAWNTAVDSGCSNLWLGYYVCTGI
ncbi:LysM domain protein [Pestalotiopsis sp. NC0098]|nr:LysM domain protein [Pestalotiopsis sp. NC0098]